MVCRLINRTIYIYAFVQDDVGVWYAILAWKIEISGPAVRAKLLNMSNWDEPKIKNLNDVVGLSNSYDGIGLSGNVPEKALDQKKKKYSWNSAGFKRWRQKSTGLDQKTIDLVDIFQSLELTPNTTRIKLN